MVNGQNGTCMDENLCNNTESMKQQGNGFIGKCDPPKICCINSNKSEHIEVKNRFTSLNDKDDVNSSQTKLKGPKLSRDKLEKNNKLNTNNEVTTTDKTVFNNQIQYPINLLPFTQGTINVLNYQMQYPIYGGFINFPPFIQGANAVSNNQIQNPIYGGFGNFIPVNIMFTPIYMGFLTFLIPYPCQNTFYNGQSCNYLMNLNPVNINKDVRYEEPNVEENEPPALCITSSGKNGVCVNPIICNDDGTLLNFAESVLKGSSKFGECVSPLKCCILPSQENDDRKNDDDAVPDGEPQKPPEESIDTDLEHDASSIESINSEPTHPPPCKTSSGRDGVCVQPGSCKEDGTVQLYAESVLIARFGNDECESPLKCCIPPSDEGKEIIIVTTLSTPIVEENLSIEPEYKADQKMCTTGDGKNGVCVKSEICNENGTVHIYAQHAIIPRFGADECQSDERCCVLPEEEKPEIKINNNNRDRESITPAPTNCGHVNSMGLSGQTPITEGPDTLFGEFPWVVAVLRSDDVDDDVINTYLGGGSIVHIRAVLTAAHTVKGKGENLFIRAGEWDSSKECPSQPGCTDSPDESQLHQERLVESVVIHEKFSEAGLLNDIAILILNFELDIGGSIGIVCLPPPSVEAPPANCIATGWGTFNADSEQPNILKKTFLPIVRRSDCEKRFKSTSAGYYFRLHESFICAGGISGKDDCIGNGGSPLICPMPNNPNVYMQSGIVSWGLECGLSGIPTVYTNIAHFRKWIDDHLFSNALY